MDEDPLPGVSEYGRISGVIMCQELCVKRNCQRIHCAFQLRSSCAAEDSILERFMVMRVVFSILLTILLLLYIHSAGQYRSTIFLI